MRSFLLRHRRGLLLILGAFSLGFITRTADDFFEISKNMEIFGELYTEVNQTYVDETNPTELMRTSIDAMLASLDPYTNYYSESQIEYAKLINSGQYSGIGAEIGLRRKRPLVLELYGGGPAAEAGLRVGDVILQIDDVSVIESQLSLDEVKSLLLGEKGSTVSLLIERSGEAQNLAISLQRGGGTDQREDVPYSGMINDSIGYLSLAGFTGSAAREVRAALDTLRQQQPDLAGVVLDLRGNPGGRLDQAVDICNLFMPSGKKIVEMRGRTLDSKNVFYTRSEPWDADLPVAIVVNSRSASASEIVAGAMQDRDRGVVVGRKSFGKGLVQRVMPLTKTPQTQMKVTVAKYYTPSGRCIQAIDYSHRNPDGSVGRVPDSLTTAFKTRNGRTVYDGGGIAPDIEVEKPDPVPALVALEEQGLIFDFASQYANEKAQIADVRRFDVSDELYRRFVDFTQERDFDFRTDTEQKLKQLETALAEGDYSEAMQGRLRSLRDKLAAQKDQDLFRYQDMIAEQLREEIIRRFYFKQGVIEGSFNRDPDLLTAVEVLQDRGRYRQILQGTR